MSVAASSLRARKGGVSAEIVQLDMQIKDGKVELYRAKVKVSFKYQGGD